MTWNESRSEKLCQAAVKRAGIAKKYTFAYIGTRRALVVVTVSLGSVRMAALHQLLYQLRIIVPSRLPIDIEEGHALPRPVRIRILPRPAPSSTP